MHIVCILFRLYMYMKVTQQMYIYCYLLEIILYQWMLTVQSLYGISNHKVSVFTRQIVHCLLVMLIQFSYEGTGILQGQNWENFSFWYEMQIQHFHTIFTLYRTCWSRGNMFDCRSRGPWFEYYTSLTWISLGTRNESPSLHSTKVWIGTLRRLYLCKFDIPGCHILSAHKIRSEIVSPRRPEW